MKKIKSIIVSLLKHFKHDSNIITIKVTEKEIQEGTKISSQYCPIALAIKNKTGKTASVGISTMIITANNREYRIYNKSKIIRFIRKFDAGNFVKPFSFKIDLKKEKII